MSEENIKQNAQNEQNKQVKAEAETSPQKENDQPDQKTESNDDVIITEEDLISIKVRYSKKDKKILVENVDENFDENTAKSITVYFKYPSFSDARQIMTGNSNPYSENVTVADLRQLEFSRLLVLVRKWSLDKDIATHFQSLDVGIIDALVSKLREEIGLAGIT